MTRQSASEWGCIVSGIVTLGTAIGWAFHLITSASGFWLPLVSILAAILCGVLFYMGKKLDVRSKTPGPTASPLNNWCTELIKEDAKRMQERIMAPIWEPHAHLDLGEPNPYIDFRVTFVNATVFHLKAESIEGESQYRNSPLPQHLKLVSPLTLYHGESKTVVLRQHLTRETATALQSARGVVKLDLNRIRIKFKLMNDVYLPGAPFDFLWNAPEVTLWTAD